MLEEYAAFVWKEQSVLNIKTRFFYVFLTAYLSIFISVTNQLDAQNICLQ